MSAEACDPARPAQQAGCFGIQLKALDDTNNSPCVEGFVAGQPHLTNKFCRNCCVEGLAVQASRVRALAEDARATFKNTNGEGFWSIDTAKVAVPFRVINQHKRCVGPALVLFAEDLPPDAQSAEWYPVPPEYVTSEGLVWLRVAYATLIPMRKRGAAMAKVSSSSSSPVAASSPTESPPPQPSPSAPTMAAAAAIPAASALPTAPALPALPTHHHSSCTPVQALATAMTPLPLATTPFVCAIPIVPSVHVPVTAPAGVVQSPPQSAPMDGCGMLDLDAHFPVAADELAGTLHAFVHSGVDDAVGGRAAAVATAYDDDGVASKRSRTGVAALIDDGDVASSTATPWQSTNPSTVRASQGSPSSLDQGMMSEERDSADGDSGGGTEGDGEEGQDEEWAYDALFMCFSAADEGSVSNAAVAESKAAVDATASVACSTDDASNCEEKLPRPCVTCRERRTLCDRRNPCTRCVRLGVECKLPPNVKRGRPTHADQLARIAKALSAQAGVSPPTSPPEHGDDTMHAGHVIEAKRVKIGIGILLVSTPLVLAFNHLLHDPEHEFVTTNTTGADGTVSVASPLLLAAGQNSSLLQVSSSFGFFEAAHGALIRSALLTSLLLVFTSIFCALVPGDPPKWLMPYLHAINVVTAAARIQSTLVRFQQVETFDESAVMITTRQRLLCASCFGAVVRAAASSCSHGTLFWWSNRVFSVYQAVILLVTIGVLHVTENPPLYPPNDVPLQDAFAMPAALVCCACFTAPRIRQKIAGACRQLVQRTVLPLDSSMSSSSIIDVAHFK